MAAITPVLDSTPKSGDAVYRWSGTGTANQADDLTSDTVPKGGSRRLLYTTCSYSAAPTQSGVIVEVDSGLGAAYDYRLFLHTANGQDNVYQPDEPLWLLPGDAVKVSAPAGGAGITAAITIVEEAQ